MTISQSVEKRTLKSVLAGLVSFIVSFAQSILLVPIFLQFWGEEKYAAWIASWAFIYLMRMLDQGFLGFVGNEFTKAYHVDKIEAGAILGSSVRMAFVSGFIELAVFPILFISGLGDYIVGIPDTPENRLTYLGIFIALIPWAIGGSVTSVVVRIVPALGMYDKMLYFSIIMKLIELIVIGFGAYFNLSIFYVCTILSLFTIAYSFSINLFVRRLSPELFPWWKQGTYQEGFVLFTKSLSLSINNFIEQYLNSGLIVLITKVLGLAMLPVFTTIRTLTNVATQVASIIVDPLTPDIIKYHSLNEKNKIAEIFRANWLILMPVLNIFFLCSLPFVEIFYEKWTKGKLLFDVKLFYILSISVAFNCFGRPFLTYIRGLNLVMHLNIITLVRFLTLFGISYILIHKHGLVGIGFGVLISEIIGSCLIPAILVINKIDAIKFKDMALPVFSIGLLSFLYILDYFQVIFILYLTIGFFCLQSIITYHQWNSLDISVQKRILFLITKYL